MYIVSCIQNKNYQVPPFIILHHYYLILFITSHSQPTISKRCSLFTCHCMLLCKNMSHIVWIQMGLFKHTYNMSFPFPCTLLPSNERQSCIHSAIDHPAWTCSLRLAPRRVVTSLISELEVVDLLWNTVDDVLLVELPRWSSQLYQRRRQYRLSNAKASAAVKSSSGMSARCVFANGRRPHVRQPVNNTLKLCLNFSCVTRNVSLHACA